MKSGPGYPLAPLCSLRERRLEEARRLLGEALALRAQAGALAEEAERAHLGARELLRAAEGAAFGATAAELEARGRWWERLHGEERRLLAVAQRCAGALSQASERVEEARGRLLQAERELQVIERHRERWEAERRRGLDAARDAEADELAGGGRDQRRT